MSIAYEFLKDEKISLNIEDSIVMLIQNYNYIMKLYRIIKRQYDETQEKKKKAHKELTKLREKEELLRKNKIVLTNQEKIELAERKEYLTRLREEEDIIYFDGKPISYDQLSYIIIEYQNIFKVLEISDRHIRQKIALISKLACELLLLPCKYMVTITMKQTNKKTTTFKSLKSSKKFICKLPKKIEDLITSDLKIDLNKHRPPK